MALSWPGCNHDKSTSKLFRDATIQANPNPSVPLAAILHIETTTATKITLDIVGATLPTHVEFTEFRTKHELPVLGLVPGKTNTITVTAESENHTKESKTLPWQTNPLPFDFPPIKVKVSDPTAMEPGLTLFNVYQWNPFLMGVIIPHGWLIAVNAAGEVVWYHHPDVVPGDARQLPNGHLIYEYDQMGFMEIDTLGNVLEVWHAVGLGAPEPEGATIVQTDTMHHDMQELPNGHFLSLSTAMIAAPNYPTNEKDANAPLATVPLIVDKINEFDRSGQIVQSWFMDDFIDVYRLGYDSLSPFWDMKYIDVATGTKDWSHANAIVYSEHDDSIVVSLRNQDALVKFHRASGKLVWILGPPDNWKSPWSEALLKAPPDMPWFYHQHAPKVFPDGRILLFDNGNFRASPPNEKMTARKNHSRVVEYRVDEAKKTVEQTWVYGGDDAEAFYSPFLGDADALPKTGNVLVTDGGRVVDNQGIPSDEILAGHKWARIFEITRETSPRKVFELYIQAPHPIGFAGWSVYRADRIPSLYRQ